MTMWFMATGERPFDDLTGNDLSTGVVHMQACVHFLNFIEIDFKLMGTIRPFCDRGDVNSSGILIILCILYVVFYELYAFYTLRVLYVLRVPFVLCALHV